MTKKELVRVLHNAGGSDREVLFCVPEMEEMDCLTAYLVQTETAHDEDGMAFIRVYLESAAAEEGE